jgi:hypothetical protein
MAKYDCDICQGHGTIRLPLYRRVMAFTAEPDVTMQESSRSYPCPECSDKVPFAQVGVVTSTVTIETRISDPKYLEHVKHSAAMGLMDEIIRAGYVQIEVGPDDTREFRREYRVTLGVVSPKQVATLEERVAGRQTEVAHAVVKEAEHQINNWGSFYGHADILKRDATRMVREAIQAVLAKRAAWKRESLGAGQ